MKELAYILCCSKNGTGVALPFYEDEKVFLKAKYNYYSKRGYTIVFYAFRPGCLVESNISDFLTNE